MDIDELLAARVHTHAHTRKHTRISDIHKQNKPKKQVQQPKQQNHSEAISGLVYILFNI